MYHGYMCILLYVKIIQCSGFPEIFGGLEVGGGVSVKWDMCILLYVTIIQFSHFPQIYAQLEEGGWGQSAMGIHAFCYI